MRIKEKSDSQAEPVDVLPIDTELAHVQRCKKLFPGFTGYEALKSQLLSEADEHIKTIETAIAQRYHHEHGHLIIPPLRLALRSNASLIYLDLVRDVRTDIFKRTCVETS